MVKRYALIAVVLAFGWVVLRAGLWSVEAALRETFSWMLP